MNLRAAFFGTPAAAVPSLAALAEVADVALVVTRQDKPRGRSGKPQPSPVKVAAEQWGMPLAQPHRAAEIAGELRRLELDVAVVTAYGQLLPADVLAATRRGFINVHFSLLPRWRGAAPVQRALLAGDSLTGVSLLALDEGLDTGPVVAKLPAAIGPDDSAGTLTARLSALGAQLLADQLGLWVADEVVAVPQDESEATPAPKISVEEARIDFGESAARVRRAVQAFNPRPGAWTMLGGDRFKIFELAAIEAAAPEPLAPGRILVESDAVLVGTGSDPLRLVTVQPSGKAPMAAAAWARGHRGELTAFS